MRYITLIGMLMLGGCVTAEQGWVRAHGRTNPERLQFALAQCRAEGATAEPGVYVEGGRWAGLAANLMVQAATSDAVAKACMARFGYVMAQPPAQPAR